MLPSETLRLTSRQASSLAASACAACCFNGTAAHGGRTIVALGRTEILGMYLAAGLTRTGTRVHAGAVTFEVLSGQVSDLAERLAEIDDDLHVHESAANFVLLTLPRSGPTAAGLVAACRRDGVFLRDLSPLSPAFEGRTVRITVRDPDANDRVAATVSAALDRLRTAA